MKTRLAALAATIMALAATPVLADANTDDIHCYIIFSQMDSSKNDAIKTAAIVGGIYYLGRLDGRASDLDVEASILAELPKMKGDLFAAEAKRCGAEMQARGAAAMVLGRDLQEKSAAATQQENPK